MFPIDKFASVKAELISDPRSPSKRLFRYKSEGPLEPYYRFTLTSPPLDLRTGMAVDAILDSYHGNVKNFDLKNPIPQQASHTGLYLFQQANEGSDVVIIGGYNPNELDAAVAGDFITINGSRKAYRVCFDSNADDSGKASIKLTQPLIQSYSASATIDYGSEVSFLVCMEDRDSGEVSVQNGKFIVHDVELIEQL